MLHAIARLRLKFWTFLNTATDSTRFDPRAEAAHYDILERRRRLWTVCPEGGGSNLTLYGTRLNALEFAAKMGSVRYVIDDGAIVIYAPRP